MGIREELVIKRLEISLMEADVRIEDMQAEIEKIKERRNETEQKLKGVLNTNITD